MSTVRVAVTQVEPVWLDLPATVSKTCTLIEEAAQNGAQLISFPESWIPGYPAWIWDRSVDFDMAILYNKNCLKVDSPEMQQICASAKKNKIAVSLGFSENYNSSLYIAQAIIGSDGEIKMKRRKIKPTHMERTIFGDGSGSSLINVVDVPGIGRVGSLACWEHTQPLLKYHTCTQNEAIHIAAWPPLDPHTGGPGLFSMSREGAETLSRAYAMESQTFVLHTTTVIGEKGIEKMKTATGVTMNVPGGGASAIIGPDGRKLSKDIPETEEGIIYADLNMNDITKAKGFLDICGHYSRPDMLWLGVDNREKQTKRAE